jgi:outer membrane protein TolC
MKFIPGALVLMILAGAGVPWADTPVKVTDAQPPAIGSPQPETGQPAAPVIQKLAEVPPSPSEGVLTPEQVQLLNQKIDVRRIDIDRLREILEGEAGGEALRLSLEECLRVAIENNPDLQIVRYEPLRSAADILAVKGEFDPILGASATYVRATQEASPEYRQFGRISTIDSYRTTSKYSVSGKLKWGTTYDASFNWDKEQTTFTGFNDEWSGGLTLTLNQPLLRGSGGAVNLARLRTAEKARQMSDAQVRLAVMTTVAQVVKAYWDLVGAVESVTVREEALSNAERLLDIAQKRLDIGTGAAIEVLQAKAGVATRQTDLITARSQVADAEDLLKQILNLRDHGIFSAKRIVPTDRPKVAEFNLETLKNNEEQLAKSIELALKNRPEIVSSQLEIETAGLERTRAANAMLPQVDLTGSVFQGKRGPMMWDPFEGTLERNDNFYSVGVKGTIPIGNRAARGAFQRADLTAHQAEQKLERTKQELMLKVRLAARALNTSIVLVESNYQACQLQETNVAAEEKRLRLGVSTSYRVLQMQTDLTTAQTQAVQARIAFEKANVDLRLAEGTVLETLGIEFALPEPEPPISYFRSIHPPAPRD